MKLIESRKIKKKTGHIIEQNDFSNVIFEDIVTGKRPRGRHRKQNFQEIQMSMDWKDSVS